MRTKIVAGNWKMNGQIETINLLLNDLKKTLPDLGSNSKCVVFPPAVYLPMVKALLQGSPVEWGAQNVYPKEGGAFTGEISGPMLKEFGCAYVLVGHSERRHLFAENEKIVAEKYHHVKEHGMIPLLCVGETLQERQRGETQQVIARQLNAVLQGDSNCFNQGVIAYEPVWAIGTGQTAKPEQAQEVHQFIRSFVAQASNNEAESVTILYGGSVNEKNAGDLFAMPDVDGGLVGGASLHAQQFVEIVKCIN